MSDIKQYDPLWGAWQVDSLIGEGSFGKVYKVRREEFGKTYYSAVKMLSIPQSEADLRQIRGEGMDEASVRSYFHAFVADIIQEIDLMREFRGNSNIVSFEDHKVIEKSGEIGWDILIRMELLTSLSDYVMDKPLSQEEVVKLGIHICRALELCAVKKTIHRDVKPENIFVSQYGDYKLGDFGIARQIERTSSGLSKKGTYTYMAPEVFKGDEYGASVDMYSLGVVMYRFLNQNRTPFMPAFPTTIKPSDRDEALQRRMKGEPLPQIAGLNPSINAIIMKACAFDRKDRFTSPTQMREALEAVAGGGSYAPVDTPITTAGSHARTSSPQQPAGRDQTSGTAGVSGSVASKTAQPEDRTSATEGVYTSAPKTAAQEPYREATERTEGVYEAPPPRREEAARKSAPKKNWGAALAGAAAVLIAVIALFISLNNNSNNSQDNYNVMTANNPQGNYDNIADDNQTDGNQEDMSVLSSTSTPEATTISSVAVTGVNVSAKSREMTIGQTFSLTATVSPDDATNKDVIWSSDKKSVATVSSSGTITALSEGNATITAKASDGGGKYASCTVTVKGAEPPPSTTTQSVAVTGVTISQTSRELTVDQTLSLSASVNPNNAINKNVTWSSDKKAVATVNSSGTVTAVSAGSATITVKTADGGYTASCTVTVKSTATANAATTKVGEKIEFGGYKWRVLAVHDNKALLLSDSIIENRKYHNTGIISVTWADCDLRKYLNGEFYNNLGAGDRELISETQVINKDNQWFGASGGNNTNDRIFLLSLEEVVQYFGDSGMLRNRPGDDPYGIDDKYNIARASYYKGTASWWWLRSPGIGSGYAASVNYDGYVNVYGLVVNNDSGGVRPALWLNL